MKNTVESASVPDGFMLSSLYWGFAIHLDLHFGAQAEHGLGMV